MLDVTHYRTTNSSIYKKTMNGNLAWFKKKHYACMQSWFSCREEFYRTRRTKILLCETEDKKSFVRRMGKILKHFDLELLETTEYNIIAIKLNDEFKKNYMLGMLTALIKTAARNEEFPNKFDYETMAWTKPAFDLIYKNYKTKKYNFKNKINFSSYRNWFENFNCLSKEECLKKLIRKN